MSAEQIQYTSSGYDADFVHDKSTGYTGVGTASPIAPLEILGAGYGQIYFRVGDGTNEVTFVGGGFNDVNSYGASLRFYSDSEDVVFRTATADPAMTVKQSGKVGIGVTNPAARLSVIGGGSFTATGTVSVVAMELAVTGSGTSFTTEMVVGDRISVTIGSAVVIRTVTVITDDTDLTVDNVYPATASGLSVTVVPPILRADDSAGDSAFIVTGDGHAVIGKMASGDSPTLSGFLALAGSEIKDDDDVGYVACILDAPFIDKNNEMRGYQATMRYTRTTMDDQMQGWDVFAVAGAVSLEYMNLPSDYPNIHGQMKPFQSELYFKLTAGGAYAVVGDSMNYEASLTQVDSSCTVHQWAGFVVAQPCPGVGMGATSKVTTGYGIWVKNLQDEANTLVEDNAAAIKIDGLDEYGRILWNASSIYETSSGALEIDATSLTVGTTDIMFDTTNLGFYGAGPVAQQIITGSKEANPALASLLLALASLGLVVDSTS